MGPQSGGSRGRLNRPRITDAAIVLADAHGIDAVTMRALAAELGVEAMALYRHVANKDELLSALADRVLDHINTACNDLHSDPGDWRAELRARILTARTFAVAHSWFPQLLQSRGAMTPALMRYYDDVAGILFRGGFTADLLHNALHTLGSRLLGFSQEVFAPTAPAVEDGEATLAAVEAAARLIPNISQMLAGITHDDSDRVGWCDDQAEFEFALDLILAGLEMQRSASGPSHTSAE